MGADGAAASCAAGGEDEGGGEGAASSAVGAGAGAGATAIGLGGTGGDTFVRLLAIHKTAAIARRATLPSSAHNLRDMPCPSRRSEPSPACARS